ncbi:MAG: zinc ribbon domain-containing protein, partial [Thermoplasmata archaeon]
VQPGGARALQRLHLVGSFSAEVEWAYGEALGIPGLEVRRHPANAPGLWGALAAAAHDAGSTGREAVLTADTASIATDATGGPRLLHGAGAVAFLLGSETGLAVLRHGFRGHAPGRAPSMKGSVTEWLDALGVPPGGGTGEVVLAVEEEPARWQSMWEEVAPGVTVTLVEAPFSEVGTAPTLRTALLLWELGQRLRTGDTGLVGESRRGRSGFAGFRLDGPIRWLGDWGIHDAGLEPPGGKFLERAVALNAVSQGAYVPHSRYLENLASRWRLVGERCTSCRAITFPATGRCRSCGRSDGLRAEALPRSGLEIQAITTISPGAQPTEFDSMVEATGAYDVAIVALGPGTRATVQLTDSVPGRVHVGDLVGLVLRRLYPMEGEWRYGLKAVPQNPGARGVDDSGALSSSASRSRRPSSSEVPTAGRANPRGRGGRAAARPRRGR